MNQRYPYGRRLAWGLLLSTMLLLNSGCVYWRLNQFRKQLSDFPSHFRIEERERPTIVALQPVLRPDDLGWLSGLAASDTVEQDGRVTEIYAYVKQYDDSAHDEKGAYDLEVRLLYNDEERLEAVQVPNQFASIVNEKNFDEVFRPMADGYIERMRHATGWLWEEHRVNIPVRDDIEYFFGVPTTVAEADEGLTYTYAYRLQGSTTETEWNPTGWDAYVSFVFEPEAERVIYTESYNGRMQIIVDLHAEKNAVEIKRL